MESLHLMVPFIISFCLSSPFKKTVTSFSTFVILIILTPLMRVISFISPLIVISSTSQRGSCLRLLVLISIFSYRNFKYFAPSHEHFSLKILLYRLANNMLHRIFPYLISLFKSGSLLSLKRFSFEKLDNYCSTLSFVFAVQICFTFIKEFFVSVLVVKTVLESILIFRIL